VEAGQALALLDGGRLQAHAPIQTVVGVGAAARVQLAEGEALQGLAGALGDVTGEHANQGRFVGVDECQAVRFEHGAAAAAATLALLFGSGASVNADHHQVNVGRLFVMN